MIETEITQKEVREVKAYICDGCRARSERYNIHGPDIANFSYTFGFPSPQDGTRIEFDLCEECLMQILKEAEVEFRTKQMF